MGDFFLQHRGIWYTLGQLQVSLPAWKYICVALDTRTETAFAAANGQALSGGDNSPGVAVPGLRFGWTKPEHILQTSTVWVNNDIVGLVNLFSGADVSAVEDIQCGQPGRLLAWNVSR